MTLRPATSTVPPLFIPVIASAPPGSCRPSHRLSSWMHGQAGRRRRAEGDGIAQVVAVAVGHQEEVAARRPRRRPWGCCGLPNHGSNRMVLPPGVPTSTQAWPYQVNVVSPSNRHRVPPSMHRTLGRGCARIAENLAFINWTVLAGLGVGAFAAAVVAPAEDRRDAGLSSPSAAGLRDGLRPCWPTCPTGRCRRPVCRLDGRRRPGLDRPRRAALVLFTVLAARLRRRGGRRHRAAALGIAGLVAGVAASPSAPSAGAAARSARSVPLLVQLLRPGGGHRRRLRGDDPRPLVPRDAEAARGAPHPAQPAPARHRRRPGRSCSRVDASRRGTGGGGPFSAAVRAVGPVRLAAPARRPRSSR